MGSVTVQTAAGPVVSQAPDLPGNYLGYYAQLGAHLQGQAVQPDVTPEQVYQAMELLTLGAHSAEQGARLAVVGAPSLPSQ